jgi:hypothetical protein
MDLEIKKFFELFIGYDGNNWSIDHAKKHHKGAHSYFLYDMSKMIKNHVGYPSLLYLMNTIAFLGYCFRYDENWEIPLQGREKKVEFENIGKKDDFVYFCKTYLKLGNEKYEKLAEELFEFARNRLSHIYITHNIVTTYPSEKHLEIENRGTNYPHMLISIFNFFEDTKKATKLAYEELEQNKGRSYQFIQKQKFILTWAWEIQKGLNNITSTKKTTDTSHSVSPSITPGGVSGVVTPPQFPPQS